MKKWLKALILPALLVLVLAGCGKTEKSVQETATASDEVYTVKLGHIWSPGHFLHESMVTYIERIEELSEGRIKVEHYPAGQLGSMKDMLDLASTGAVDIAQVTPSIFAGQLPLNAVVNFPFYKTAVEGTEIYNTLLEAAPELQEEFARYGTKVLFQMTTNQYDVGTVDKPVRSPEDLKGLTLSSTGGMTDIVGVAYGVNVRTVAAPELYESTQKGIIEGNILSFPSVQGYKLNELEKYHTFGLSMGNTSTVFVMNQKKWESLPVDLQDVLSQVNKEMGNEMAVSWDKRSLELKEEFVKAGVEIYTVPPEDKAKWAEPLEGIEEDWIANLEKKGIPAQKVFDEFEKISTEVTN